MNIHGLYIELLSNSNLDGFIVKFESYLFFLLRRIFDVIDDVSENKLSTYDSIRWTKTDERFNKQWLDEFINNPANIGKYEGLFEKISQSTILTLRLAKDDLVGTAEDGVILMVETGP